jgi:hypothetical protein
VKKKLSDNEMKVFIYLMNNNTRVISPTEIGNKVGGSGRHSAWASPICKRLVKHGIIFRSAKGHYYFDPMRCLADARMTFKTTAPQQAGEGSDK